MHLFRSGSLLVVQAPAKLNLFFEVLARRKDGFHEIETLVYPIDLYDTLFFREDSGGQVTLGCDTSFGSRWPDGPELGSLPAGPNNLVVRAVELLRREAGVGTGAMMRLIKRIPVAAGLGGGSSDAAAALVAANTCWDLGWSRAELSRLGAELGSDVPLFLAQGPVVCRGRGECVERAFGVGMMHFVVVRPPAGLSTAEVYQHCEPARQPRHLKPLLEALVRGDLARSGRLFFNRLEVPAARLSPWIERLRQELDGMDCWGHQMSGSGSCYFGLCHHARHARRVARAIQARGVGVAFAVRGSR
jgi:4-diphosphocytidyl-2-C-methyl-D-erythritol kinase